ncbi:MAG: class I SAM-dependent methyltransferase [Bacteroidales bacterium]
MKVHNDLLGMALNDFYTGDRKAKILVHSPDFERDEIPVSLYFREFEEMPEIEKRALNMCRDKILDAGAGAGSHSLYLQKKGMDITALDISGGACEVMNKRGVKKIIQQDIFEYNGPKFNTLLMLMNGIGICGNIEKLDYLLSKLPMLIERGGQFIFDSTNLIYLYQDENKLAEIDINDRYFGEIQFRLEYDDYFTPSFGWIYIDFDTLSWLVERKGMRAEKLMDGDNYHYLARILV